MTATIVAYRLGVDPESGGPVWCGTVLGGVGMQPAWYPDGEWWSGSGPVPHADFPPRGWAWIAFASEADAEADAAEARRHGHDAVVLGEMDVYRRPWGWGQPAVTDAVRRAMMAMSPALESPKRGMSVVVI